MADTQERASDPRPRPLLGWAVPIVAAVAILAIPPLIYTVASGWIILVSLIAVSLVAGLVDAAVFRFNYLTASFVGVAYLFAMILYFNEGTWIYLPLLVVVTLLGELVPTKLKPKAPKAVA